MKPIMIASYLGILQTTVSSIPIEDEMNRAHFSGMLQALREAQMYFYELARQDLLKEMGYEETDSTMQGVSEKDRNLPN